MAIPSIHLISSIRKTIQKLKNGTAYQWGHMGACNCGNLAQELTKLSKDDIHRVALQGHGDWNEQLREYCPSSGFPMDTMISQMLEAGLTLDDLGNLENLSDPKILARIEPKRRHSLRRNVKEDVIVYMVAWADLLETEWLAHHTPRVEQETKKISPVPVLS